MNICYVLPKVSRYPIGGYKIVFEYANRLSKLGNQVSILFLNDNLMVKYHIPEIIRRKLAKQMTKAEPKWFSLSYDIKKISGLSTMDLSYFDFDIVIATAVETVEFVKKFRCKKCYFIQGYETWNVDEDYLYSTYAAGMKNIVVAKWLKPIVDRYSKTPSVVIKNPIDVDIYKITKPIEKRFSHTISLLYHEDECKGFTYAWKAILQIKNKYPDLRVYMFGRRKYPGELPNWVKYTANASQNMTVQIYNETRVFLCASVVEGFGLTGLEAMACGNILVSTDYEGVKEYAVDEVNALLSPVKDVDALVRNVCRAFEEDDLCNRLRTHAMVDVQGFSWQIATDNFNKVLESIK